MIFDWTITLGNLLTVGSFLLGGIIVLVGAFVQFKSLQVNLGNVSDRMDKIEEELKKQTQILVDQAAARERMIAMERRIDELYKKFYKQ